MRARNSLAWRVRAAGDFRAILCPSSPNYSILKANSLVQGSHFTIFGLHLKGLCHGSPVQFIFFPITCPYMLWNLTLAEATYSRLRDKQI